jgi:general secretion pathway protein J
VRGSRPSVARGFTLVEVLIAATLMAVMMTLVLGGLRVGVRSWGDGTERMERMSRMLIAQQFLRGHLSGALPLVRNPNNAAQSLTFTENQPSLLFRGGRDWLEYVATLPPAVKGGLYAFRLYLEGDDEKRDLKVTIRPMASANGGEAPPIDDVTLVENVDMLKFQYFKKNAGESFSQQEWKDEWHEELMPDLIRVDIALRDEPAWPALLIEPKIEVRR